MKIKSDISQNFAGSRDYSICICCLNILSWQIVLFRSRPNISHSASLLLLHSSPHPSFFSCPKMAHPSSVLNEPVGSQSARSRAYAVSHSQSNSTSQSEILANWLGLHPDCVIYMVLSLVMADLKLPEKGRRGGLPAVPTRQDLALFSSLRASQQPPPLYPPHLHELSINFQSDYCIRILVINIPRRKSTQPSVGNI